MNNYKYNPIKMSPFKWFVLENFPFIEEDFDSLTSYGLWCKLKQYFDNVAKKTNEMGTQVESLTNAFIVLKDYVDNYFANLDVQDEINNKLDDMAEKGTLQEIINSYLQSNCLWIFNNVNDMKNATNIRNGSKCKTLGYYEKNDGGDGIYLIRNRTFDDVIDNGKLHLINENTVAELIFENNINVKQFGAKGDGTNDDTSSIQNAINSLREKILNSDIANVNMVLFPAGKYKITETIIVSPFVKLKTLGYTALLSYVNNGACLHFTPQANDFNNSIGDKQDWFRGPWLNGEAGLIIKYMGNDNTNAIGIKIGSNTNLGALLTASRFSMNDFRLQGFNIAILYNYFNVYIATLNRVSVENNKIGVQYGSTVGRVTNSGEKMSFNDCLFAGNDVSVKWLCDGMDSYFINSSFDFNKCIFFDETNKGYHNISVSNSHVEGNGSSDTSIPRGIVYGKMQMTKIDIHNCNIYTTENVKMFTVGTDETPGYILSLENNQLLFNRNNYNASLENLADDKIIPVLYNNNCYNHDSKARMFNNAMNVIPQDFSNLTIGTIEPSATKIGNLDISNKSHISSLYIIDNDNPLGLKTIVADLSSGETTGGLHLKTDFIPVIPHRFLALKSLTKGTACNILVTFYDANKNEISSTNNYINNSDLDKSNWYIQTFTKRVRIPKNCYYVKVTYQCSIVTEFPEIKIGNLYCQYE